jgi:hypothetical protein
MHPTDQTSTLKYVSPCCLDRGNGGVRLTSFGVALEAQHNLRGTIPSRSNIFSHVSGILLRVYAEASSQTKVTNLELAVRVYKQVSGLKIAVEDIGGVDVLQTAQDLVDEGLEVGVCKGLARADDGCQVAFHELCVVLVYCRDGQGSGRLLAFV